MTYLFYITFASQTTKKLEMVGVLQAYTDEEPPRRLRVDAEVMYKRVFAFFCLYTVCVYWVSWCASEGDLVCVVDFLSPSYRIVLYFCCILIANCLLPGYERILLGQRLKCYDVVAVSRCKNEIRYKRESSASVI